MEDKLLKVLKIKIDAINKNIENLNYLNGEIEKNNTDLEYIEKMISLFKDNDVLNFDNISKEDFEKILSMINPNVSEIFKDKTCNYEGIIYIIQGIRKSISLQLTEEQNNAILNFIDGMKEKSLNLNETIANLFENKNRLPETDLNILQNNLENYQNIVSKFENNLYLTEIDDIGKSLDFANVSIEEKVDVFEFLLKYNANIYNLSKEDEPETTNDAVEENNFDFELPEFHYEPIDLNNVKESIEETEHNTKDDDLENTNNLNDIKFNLDNIIYDKPTADTVEIPSISNDINEGFELKNDDSESEEHELNTIELEDIIQKIDAKLKEMEANEKKEQPVESTINEENEFESVPEIETNIVPAEEVVSEDNITEAVDNSAQLMEIFNKYQIPSIEINNTNIEDIDQMLSILNDNKLLDKLNANTKLMEQILTYNNSYDLNEMLLLAKDNFVVKDEYDQILDIMLNTMPILFVNKEVINSFKENINFFKEKNINLINLFDNYRELLIINNDLLKDNYNKVISYGIEVNNDNVKYLLYNKNVLNNLDYYIEAIGAEKGFLGKEDYFDGLEYIKKNPYKLNYISRNTLLKLRYATENNIKIYGNKPGVLSGEISNPKVDIIKLDSNYVSGYFNSNYDFINQSALEEIKTEINNTKSFDMTLDGNINKLDEKYKLSDLKYKMNNVIISRLKTIRVYNLLKNKMSLHDALLIALTYNSVLKIEEYKNIENIVNNIINGGN